MISRFTSVLSAVVVVLAYSCGYYGLNMTVALAVLAPLVYVLVSSHIASQVRELHRETQRAERDSETVDEIRARYPERETLSWLNGCGDKIWPNVEPKLSAVLSHGIEKLVMKKVPVYISEIYFERFSLGETAPRFLNVYHHANKTEFVVLDVGVKFECQADILLRVKFGAKLLHLNVPILVQDVVMNGRLRVEAKFQRKRPYIDIIKLSFIETPDLDFSLRPLVYIDVQYIPGIQQWLHSALLNKISSLLVWPTKLALPISVWMQPRVRADGSVDDSEQDPLPSGILHVTIHRARNLETAVEGNSSPYVSVRVDTQEHETKTLYDTTSPEWSEEVDFVIRQDIEEATVHVTVCHDGGDIVLGFIDIDVRDFLLKHAEEPDQPSTSHAHEPAHSEWYTLKGTEQGEVFIGYHFEKMRINSGKSIAKVLKKVAHMHITSRRGSKDSISSWTSRRAPSGGNAEGSGRHFLGTLTLNLLAGADLMAVDRNGLSDPYALIEVGHARYKSRIHKKTLNPQWQEQFVIPLDETSKQLTLRIRIKDNDLFGSNTPIGDTSFDLATLNPQDHCEQWVDLDNAASGRIHYELFWREDPTSERAQPADAPTGSSPLSFPPSGPAENGTSPPLEAHSTSDTALADNYRGRQLHHHNSAAENHEDVNVRDRLKIIQVQCIGCEPRAYGQKRKTIMVYKFMVHTEPQCSEPWIFSRAYKDFEALHSKLKSITSDSRVNLPKLPTKKVFKQHAKLGTNVPTDKGGSNPMEVLETYLVQIVDCDFVMRHYHFRSFLDCSSSAYNLWSG